MDRLCSHGEDVTIVTFDKADVLTVATEAVHTSGTSSYVYVLVNGKEVKETVKVGSQGTSLTQITSGLKAGEKVVETIVTSTVPSSSSSSSSSSKGISGFSTEGGSSGGSTSSGPPSGFGGGASVGG
jgi:hypothetical protein